MYVSIVKTWRFIVMNYFIMLAEAVIKCVLFYDDGVIEGGYNKSCPGLLFFSFFFSCRMQRGLNKRWAVENIYRVSPYNSPGTPAMPRLSDLKTEQVSHTTAVNCVLSGDLVK